MPVSALAGIYQCKDEDGRTTFSDQPCRGGISKTIEQSDNNLTPFVSGRISQDQFSYPLRHGVSLWNEQSNELTLILTQIPLSDTEIQQAVLDDWSFLENHKIKGYAEIVLFFKSNKRSMKSLRAMRSNFYGLNPTEPEKAFTTHHGGGDVTGHVHKLELTKQGKRYWLAFASQEMSPKIRWNINLVLPVSQ